MGYHQAQARSMGFYPGTVMSYPDLGSPIPLLSLSLSEDDVTRIASKMKSMITTDVNTLVQSLVSAKVAEEMTPLKEEVKQLRQFKAGTIKEVIALKERVDDQEQYSRRMCVRISGVDEPDNEGTNPIILNLAARMSVDLRASDIDRSHRVGRSKAGRSREIIVKFTNYSARLNFIKGRKQLKNSSASIYIREDLTVARKTIFYECRQLVQAKLIMKAYTMDGNIYCWQIWKKKKKKKKFTRSLSDISQVQTERQSQSQSQPRPRYE